MAPVKNTPPSLPEVMEFVRHYDKRVGLRMLYQKFSIPKPQREKYRELWNVVWEALPDAFEKEHDHAGPKRKTKKGGGHRPAPSGETESVEPVAVENES